MQVDAKFALNKKKLLYIFKKFGKPISISELTNFILTYDFFDYFFMQEILNALIVSDLVTKKIEDENEIFSLTKTGVDTITMFQKSLPIYFIKEVEEAFDSAHDEVEQKDAIFSHYYKKSEKEYVIVMQVQENNRVVFDLSLHAPNEELASKLCKNWDENPSEIYSELLNVLTKNL